MSTTNLGGQNVTYAYKEYAKGSEFNKQLRGILKPGIYNGGLLLKASNSSIIITPFDVWFNVDSDKACHISTNANITLSVSEATPVLYMTFAWVDSTTNYIDFGFKAIGAPAVTNEIIVGRVLFTGGIVNGSFDYSNRTLGLIDNSGNVYSQNAIKFDISNDYNLYKLTSGTIGVSNNISSKSFIPNYVTVTSSTQQLAVNTTYYINYSAGRCTLTLPTTSIVGDIIKIQDIGTYGWKIAQNSGQNILLPNGRSTITGTSDDIHSRVSYSTIELLCTVANTTWKIVDLQDMWIMKGYCMGGLDTGYTAVIEDMNFTFELSTTISATLNTAKEFWDAGVSGNKKGYVMGAFPLSAVIEDLNFSVETSDVITATLDVARFAGTGLYSSIKGYCFSGCYAVGSPQLMSSAIDDLNYATETSAAISATSSAPRDAGAGISSNLRGYCLGGMIESGGVNSLSNIIESLTFSSELCSTLSATLSALGMEATGIESYLKGYICGGNFGSTVNTIRDLNFMSELCNVLTITLSATRRAMAGVSGNIKGFLMGGDNGGVVITIECINFITETNNVISAYLDTAKKNAAGIQGYVG